MEVDNTNVSAVGTIAVAVVVAIVGVTVTSRVSVSVAAQSVGDDSGGVVDAARGSIRRKCSTDYTFRSSVDSREN